MARTNSVNFTGANQFPIANAGTDIFKKEDVQVATKSLDLHDHSPGLGLPINPAAIPAGTITSAMIADGTIQGADIATGAITTTQIADGTIATADIANQAVANAKLGTDTARLNLLTNGGFEIWQRGAGAFAGSASGTYNADRWAAFVAGGDTFSVSRDSANVDGAGSYCAAVTYTRSAGGSQFAQQCNEQAVLLRNKPVTFSVRVKCSTANAVQVAIYDGSVWTQGTFHTGGGAYETLTMTRTVAAAATGLNVAVWFTASCTAYLDNAMLVVGSVAADYAPLHPADDLARCQRYYEKIADLFFGVGYCMSATVAEYLIPYIAHKGGTPTLTVSTSGMTVRDLGNPVTVTGVAYNSPGLDKGLIQVNVASGLTAGRGSTLANGSIAVEYNP